MLKKKDCQLTLFLFFIVKNQKTTYAVPYRSISRSKQTRTISQTDAKSLNAPIKTNALQKDSTLIF